MAPLRFTLTFEHPAAHLASLPLDMVAGQLQRGDEPGDRPVAAELLDEFGGGGVMVTLERGGESVSWRSA